MYSLALEEKKEEREQLFINTAAKKGLDKAIIEKDFWVCLTLDYLFNKSQWKDRIAFKGGTSLSKVYNQIQRFSEDIDLILDWRVVGYSKDEPWEKRSNTKQQIFIEDSRIRLFRFLKEEFLPVYRKDMQQILQKDDLKIYIPEDDDGVVIFEYPKLFENSSILSAIKLEIGILGSWEPLQKGVVIPYAAEEYPHVFSHSETELLVTTVARTFWEKATILHQEANRPETSLIPRRYARHYYDLYCMSKTYAKEEAIRNPRLLSDVREFKMYFYPRGWAKYNEACIGTLKLVPASHSLKALSDDYNAMKEMIFGDSPSFEELMKAIKNLEIEINGSVK